VSEVLYRDGNADDLPAIAALFESSFTDTFAHLYAPEDLALFLAQFTPELWAREFADPAYAFHVVEAEGAIVGYVKLGPEALPVEWRGPSIELRQIYLAPDWVGKGLSPPLLDWAIAEGRRRGAQDLYLTVFVDNDRARALYRRYGFEEVGPYHFMVGNQADEDIIMRKAL
jgi:ribosomal protein S18 acetylase RimI-like enzyme